ncbi:MAG: metalloregulator ArsR/SmtB family transcription factor [Bacteroidia bacterium]
MNLNTSFDYAKASAVLKTISHPVRLEIVHHLSGESSKTVSDLVALLKLDQPSVSHHLTSLRLRGLLKADKRGKEVHYSLKEINLIQVLDCIQHCSCNY